MTRLAMILAWVVVAVGLLVPLGPRRAVAQEDVTTQLQRLEASEKSGRPTSSTARS